MNNSKYSSQKIRKKSRGSCYKKNKQTFVIHIPLIINIFPLFPSISLVSRWYSFVTNYAELAWSSDSIILSAFCPTTATLEGNWIHFGGRLTRFCPTTVVSFLLCRGDDCTSSPDVIPAHKTRYHSLQSAAVCSQRNPTDISLLQAQFVVFPGSEQWLP